MPFLFRDLKVKTATTTYPFFHLHICGRVLPKSMVMSSVAEPAPVVAGAGVKVRSDSALDKTEEILNHILFVRSIHDKHQKLIKNKYLKIMNFF